jgi:hypothetical protein
MEDGSATGVLRGNTITLDAPVPPLEGRRVRVIIVPDDAELVLSGDEQARLWNEWAKHGNQGPIEDDDDPEFP